MTPLVQDVLERDVAQALEDVVGLEPIVDVTEDVQDLATEPVLLPGDEVLAARAAGVRGTHELVICLGQGVRTRQGSIIPLRWVLAARLRYWSFRKKTSRRLEVR